MMEKLRHEPWYPAEYEIADVAAIQGLLRGDATPEQQKRALDWIITHASGVHEQTYYPGGEEGRRNTDFAEGKRFVGNSIIKLTRLNISALRSEDK